MPAKRTIRPSSDRCGTGVDAAAGNRFYATISTDPKLPERLRDDAEACHVIAERDQEGNVVSVRRRPLYDAADVAHEVEQLNSGTPIGRRSQGRLSVRERVKGGGRFAIQSPTEIVVRLVDPNNPTADRLRTLQQTGGKLDRDELPALIAQVTNEWKSFTDLDALPMTKRDLREDQIRRLLASVGKQLTDKYGI
jgi:hypothetical protein